MTITVSAAIDSKGAAVGARQFNAALDSMRAGVRSMGGALDTLRRGIFSLQGLFVAGGTGFGIKAALDAADAYQSLSARLALVARDGTPVESILGGIADAAERARAPASELATVYQRNAKALEDMGRSQEEGIRLAETLAKITTISGASAQQASAGMMQLSQAIASGRFQGDEFRSVAENLPEIMRVLQRETGKSAGELRKLASEGKLTGDVLVNALLNASESVDASFAKMPQTASSALTLLADEASRTFGKIAQDARLSETWAEAFNRIKEAMGSAEFKAAAADAIEALKALGEKLGELSGYIAPVASGFSWLAEKWRELVAVAEEENAKTINAVPHLKAYEEARLSAAAAIKEQTDALRQLKGTVVEGDGPAPLKSAAPTKKLPIVFGGGTDDAAVKRAAKLGDMLRQQVELERMRNSLQEAEIRGDTLIADALRIQIETRSRITDEMRKAQPELAGQLEAEIQISAEIERRNRLLEENRRTGERLGEALTTGLRDGVAEGKKFSDVLADVGRKLFDIVTEVALLKPIQQSIGNAFSSATGSFDFGSIGTALAGGFPFASGGIISGPMRFTGGGLAGGGIAGEAGPEAILPLRRGPGGALGVVASGGGGGTTVVNFNVAGDATDATIEKMRRMAEQVFARGAPNIVKRSVDAVRSEHVRNPAYMRR